MNKLLDIELSIRTRANSLYELGDFDNPNDERIKFANYLVDLADQLQSLTKYQSVIDFQKQFDETTNKALDDPSEDAMMKLYNQDIIITFNNSITKIPFCATSYHAITDALTEILEDM